MILNRDLPIICKLSNEKAELPEELRCALMYKLPVPILLNELI